jgi:hypothetical protein
MKVQPQKYGCNTAKFKNGVWKFTASQQCLYQASWDEWHQFLMLIADNLKKDGWKLCKQGGTIAPLSFPKWTSLRIWITAKRSK